MPQLLEEKLTKFLLLRDAEAKFWTGYSGTRSVLLNALLEYHDLQKEELQRFLKDYLGIKQN